MNDTVARLGFVSARCVGCRGRVSVAPGVESCPACISPLLHEDPRAPQASPLPQAGPVDVVVVDGREYPAGAVLTREGFPCEVRPMMPPRSRS